LTLIYVKKLNTLKQFLSPPGAKIREFTEILRARFLEVPEARSRLVRGR